ncbi:30S ribosomal protein S20 [Candidatus Saccharibacteria bacterium]|nr:30S ribosomal protein S20 [Candidatus Saccharibacteria bacterium]
MPIIKSARKRVKVAAKAKSRNARTKRNLRDSLKAFTKALSEGKTAEIAKAERAVISAIDTAAKKDVIHRNKAARQKSQVSARVKAAGVKPGKAAPKKTVTAKPAAKKAPAKKPVVKKTTATKKPATKK